MNTLNDQLHTIIRAIDGAGTVFSPGDVESLYEQYQEDEGWPEWSEEIKTHILDSWYWNKGVQDILTERGWEIIDTMITERMNNYPEKA